MIFIRGSDKAVTDKKSEKKSIETGQVLLSYFMITN